MSYQDEDDEAAAPHARVRYDGEDTSPTTTRELNGWYAYPIAAEVFAVVAVGKFILLCIGGGSKPQWTDADRCVPARGAGAAGA